MIAPPQAPTPNTFTVGLDFNMGILRGPKHAEHSGYIDYFEVRNSSSRKGSLPPSFLPKSRAYISCTRKRKIFLSLETKWTPR